MMIVKAFGGHARFYIAAFSKTRFSSFKLLLLSCQHILRGNISRLVEPQKIKLPLVANFRQNGGNWLKRETILWHNDEDLYLLKQPKT